MEEKKLSETEKERLRLFVIEQLPNEWDKFDVNAEIDSSLSYNENKDIIADKIELFKEMEINKDLVTEQELKEKIENMKVDKKVFWYSILDNIKVVVVLGGTRTGKTAFCYWLLQKYKGKKPIYVYRHPNRELIKSMGYIPIDSLNVLNNGYDAVIYFDEPQLFFEKYSKRINEIFLKICSLAAQKEIVLVFSTSDSRWINKGLESYVSHWVLKDIDTKLLKNGMMVKNIIKEMVINPDDFALKTEEYIFYSRADNLHNGMYTFKKPIYFDDRFSKAYKNA